MSRNKMRALLGTVIIILSALTVVAGINVGEPASGFSLKSVKGKDTVSLKEMTGHPTLVVFWATWCPPCKREIPLLMKLHRDYGPKGLKILAVAVDFRETKRSVLNFIERASIPYTVLWDEKRTVSREYSVSVIPTALLIDSKGIIKFRGVALNSNFQAELDKLFAPGKKDPVDSGTHLKDAASSKKATPAKT